MALTRRDFVRRVGLTGGIGAAHVAMQALGFAPVSLAYAGPPRLPAASGKGTRVAILGAGIAGLTAAWELGKAGYEVTVLEARDRVGGRNWTLRRGTRLDLTDGTSQLCEFDEGLYFNAGPARLPSHHQAILGYCREFGVELEVEVNSNRSSLLQNDAANGGKPIQQRQAINDTRGHVSELLAKAVGQGALDKDISAADKERVVEFLRAYGDLSPDLAYKGSTRSGYTTLPGAADQAGTVRDPLDLHALLDADLWNGVLFEDAFVMQATMFQPVGGMDRIPTAFEKRLAGKIRNGAMVREIRQTPTGVRIVHADARSGKVAALEADYCICTIPLPVLKDIPADFSPETKAAIAGIAYDRACKVAWQSRRFWETEAQIYGGISFLKRPTNLVWYPSGGFHKPDGILVGCYNTGEDAARFAAQPLTTQFDASRESIERLHPGKGGELRKPIAIAWHKVEHNLGPWVHWPDDKQAEYVQLNRPDGRIYLAGEHLSHVTAWQEGAALSAQHVVREIAARVAAPQQ